MRRREFAKPDILRSPALCPLYIQKRTFGSSLACPLWVISGHWAGQSPCPLHSRKQTLISSVHVSANCQLRTSVLLFDQFVGAGEQRVWHCNAECLGGLEIDDQLGYPIHPTRDFLYT